MVKNRLKVVDLGGMICYNLLIIDGKWDAFMDKTISELIEYDSVNSIKRLVDDIYNAIGIRVSFFADTGEKLAVSEDNRSFCTAAQKNPVIYRQCHECSCRAREAARKTDGVYFYHCWRGLMGACKTVWASGRIVGTIVFAGYVSSPEQMMTAEQMIGDPQYRVSEDELKDMPYLPPERVQDVINIVSIAANYLSETIQRQQAERLQTQAELKALQSQISPHFLFNALNSIGQMAFLEGAGHVTDAIYSLAAILRHSMRQNTGLITLEEELELVRAYIKLKESVSISPITYIEKIEPNVDQIMIPAFSIQPLVENAVFHGIEPTRKKGTVTLTAVIEEEHLMISVEDNGCGFDASDTSAKTNKGEISGIGINNILKRMKLYYADKFSHEIDSRPGRGTKVTMRIPV